MNQRKRDGIELIILMILVAIIGYFAYKSKFPVEKFDSRPEIEKVEDSKK